MGNTRLAVKLLSGLLHNTHKYLNKNEQIEMLMALENYSKALIVKNESEEILREAATLPLFCDLGFEGLFFNILVFWDDSSRQKKGLKEKLRSEWRN